MSILGMDSNVLFYSIVLYLISLSLFCHYFYIFYTTALYAQCYLCSWQYLFTGDFYTMDRTFMPNFLTDKFHFVFKAYFFWQNDLFIYLISLHVKQYFLVLICSNISLLISVELLAKVQNCSKWTPTKSYNLISARAPYDSTTYI